MTIKDLSKYRFIKIEIEQIRANIDEIIKLSVGSPALNGLPKGKGTAGSSVETTIQKIEKLDKKLKKKEEKLLIELQNIENFLEQIDNSVIRVIIRERYISGLKWSEIAKKLHFERTTPYYQLKKYLKVYNEKNKEN